MTPQKAPKKGNPSLWIILIVVVLIAVAAILYFGDFFNTNTNSNTNTETNTNVAVNTNTAVDQNTNSVSNTNSATNTNTSTNTNSSVNTSGWQTYESKEHGFTIKRPPEWLWQGSPSGSLVTRFIPAQEQIDGLCQLDIYDGSVDTGDISLQEGNESSIQIDATTVTRHNFYDASGSLGAFTASVSDGQSTIGFYGQIGVMYIDTEHVSCEAYLEAALKSFAFSS